MPVGEKPNILVVDDEPQITRVLKTALSSRGYAIRTASDGDDALQVMKLWTPDLVITDLRMPNMDGVELCRYLRAKSGIPILVLSVRNEERIKIDALDAGADDYITKPFSIDELLARVRAALRRASAAQQPESQLIEAGDFRIEHDLAPSAGRRAVPSCADVRRRRSRAAQAPALGVGSATHFRARRMLTPAAAAAAVNVHAGSTTRRTSSRRPCQLRAALA